MQTVNTSIISRLDTTLASGRFGKSESLKRNICTLYAGIQRLVNASTGHDMAAITSSPSVKVQIITRATLDEVLVALRNEPHVARDKIIELEQHFASFASKGRRSVQLRPETGLQPLGDWWLSDLSCAIIKRLEHVMTRDGYTEKIKMVEPIAEHREVIDNVKAFLSSIVPQVASATLSHILGIALVEARFESAYLNEAPLMFMIDVGVLTDLLKAADTILHESLHQKMADIRLTRQLFREGYDDPTSEARGAVTIPWGAPHPRQFSVARGISAHHVYVHSAFLHAAALAQLPNSPVLQGIGEQEIAHRLCRSFERASYLAKVLTRDVAIREMGKDGIQFIIWINNALDELRGIHLSNGNRLGEQQMSLA